MTNFRITLIAVALLLLNKNANASTYRIIFPDDEVKNFSFTEEGENKKLGHWNCLFIKKPGAGDPVYIIKIACVKGKDSIEASSTCARETNDGSGSVFKIFENKKRWGISLNCRD